MKTSDNLYELGNAIEEEAIKLNNMILDQGYPARSLFDLDQLLSHIKSCQGKIKSMNSRLKDIDNDYKLRHTK